MRALTEAAACGETTAASVKIAVPAAYPNLPNAIPSYHSRKKSEPYRLEVY